jgi:hypothetical protein
VVRRRPSASSFVGTLAVEQAKQIPRTLDDAHDQDVGIVDRKQDDVASVRASSDAFTRLRAGAIRARCPADLLAVGPNFSDKGNSASRAVACYAVEYLLGQTPFPAGEPLGHICAQSLDRGDPKLNGRPL